MLRTVEDDVGAYVARNMLRERVRDFVREAVTRLAQRSDVTSIVVNAHSQGTVVAFDVLRSLPDEVVDRIAALVTLGSPLRKYNLVLNWGPDTGQLARVRSWTNMWDPMDPVADPPSVTDITVNNLGKVQSSGLRAHDYWGNVDDVLEPLSTLLRSVVTGEPDGVTP